MNNYSESKYFEAERLALRLTADQQTLRLIGGNYSNVNKKSFEQTEALSDAQKKILNLLFGL